MDSKNIPELDRLFTEIGTYRKSDELKKLYQFVKKFPHIAPYNAMLLHIQKPGSNYVASFVEWKHSFNRTVKPGSRPLVILRPFGPVAFVFELSDTVGEDPFPKELLNPFSVVGEVPESSYDQLVDNMKCDGIKYDETDHGTGSAGSIQISKLGEVITLVRPRKTVEIRAHYVMLVNRNHPLETRFATILHELAHLYCGHLGAPDPNWWKNRTGLSTVEREFEAESVCWLVCERMNIKNPSAEYLNGYLENNDEIPNISMDTVLKAVGAIESMIQSKKEPRKEVIISTTKQQASTPNYYQTEISGLRRNFNS